MTPVQTRQQIVLERLEVAVTELQSVVEEFHLVMGDHGQQQAEGDGKDDDSS